MFLNTVAKYQADSRKEKSRAPQKAESYLRWTVLFYPLSSTKHDFKSYCLILEHTTVALGKTLTQVNGLISYLFYCLAT